MERAAMDSALGASQELDQLRVRVLTATHDLANSVGVALNYLAFIGEDVGGADPAHPIRPNLELIESALRRAVESIRDLRESAQPAPADPDRPDS
jgi:hypothetical protein